MPKIVEIDGEEITVFTEAELAAEKAAVEAAKEAEKSELQKKLDADAEHYKKKLDEFAQGKKGIDEKEKEANEKIETATKLAQEALQKAEEEKKARLDVVKNFSVEQFAGEDAESKKKISEEMALLNMPEGTEEEMKAKVRKAAQNAGFGNGPTSGFVPGGFGGGARPPEFKRDEKLSDSDHSQFLKEIGWDQAMR